MPDDFANDAELVSSELKSDESWDGDPIPFDECDTEYFPLHSLPRIMQDFVNDVAEQTQTDRGMAGTLALGILASCFQGRYQIHVRDNWIEPLPLFLAVIAPPAERKSPVMSAITKPVREFEAEMLELELEEIAQNETERKILEGRLRSAETAATKCAISEREVKEQEAKDLATELARFQPMYPRRILLDDTTPEKLMQILEQQRGCATICSSEGGLFDSMAGGRYEKGLNIDVYLKGFCGESITVDRVGRGTNHIPSAKLSMVFCVQPEVIQGIMSNKSFRGRGLTGRFLYCVCKSNVGNRQPRPLPIPQQVITRYHDFIKRLLAGQDSGTIEISLDADKIEYDYEVYIERKLATDWEHIKDWGGKLCGTTMRIAALIHAANHDNASQIPISAETMSAAVELGHYYSSHALAAHNIMGANEEDSDARYLWKRIAAINSDRISKRDLQRISKKFKKVNDMEPAIRVLTEMNYIREIVQQTGGRPTTVLVVNPRAKRLA